RVKDSEVGRRRIQRRIQSGGVLPCPRAGGRHNEFGAAPRGPPRRASPEKLMLTDPMAEKGRATKTALLLHLTVPNEPELWQTEFTHPQYTPSGGRRAVRGKDAGAWPGAGTFEWTGAVQVLTAYLLRCSAWGRREARGLPAGEFP